jgi:hypothetical protein
MASMLDAPVVPIEMKVFQGGGDASLLEQPQESIPLQVFKGGVVETRAQRAKREAEEASAAIAKAATLAKAPSSTPTISPEVDLELDTALGTPEEVEVEAKAKAKPVEETETEAEPEKVSEEDLAPKPPAPTDPTGKTEVKETPITNIQVSDDIETVKLSNGIRVRAIPDDPEKEKLLKEDIQSLHFTNEEEILFRDYLKLDHPFIRGYITSAEMKEDFYKFWKLYVSYDGSDNFILSTYNEGIFIQRFLKKVLEAYRKYLMSTSLAYLMKQEESDYKKEPEGELGYELFDITYGEPKLAVSPEQLEADKKRDSIDKAILEEENKEAEDADELEVIRRVERAEKAEGLSGSEQGITDKVVGSTVAASASASASAEAEAEAEAKTEVEEEVQVKSKNEELREIITKIFTEKSATPEIKVMRVIKELDDRIPNKQTYQQKIMNSPLITVSSLIKNKIPPSKLIEYDFEKNPSITEFLRTLLKVDLSSTKFKKEDRTQFVIFFSKVVSNEAAARLSSYIAPIAEKRTRKVNFQKAKSNESSSRIRVRTSRKARSK